MSKLSNGIELDPLTVDREHGVSALASEGICSSVTKMQISSAVPRCHAGCRVAMGRTNVVCPEEALDVSKIQLALNVEPSGYSPRHHLQMQHESFISLRQRYDSRCHTVPETRSPLMGRFYSSKRI